MGAKIPGMDYRQHRAACRLVHECCNYDNGNCILLDNGEPCVCVQSISYSLLCRWFIAAVWKPPFCTGQTGNAVPSAAGIFSPSPTGGNTARIAPQKCAAGKKPSDNGKDTTFLRI